VHEFVEECRVEWRRLGVPDPIANEMATDLAADIAEAEAEGGSAEDVLGDSLFDPRRFAASWAGARGVTNPARTEPLPGRWPVRALAAAGVFTVLIVAAAVLLVGHRSASVAVSVRRVLGPGASHWIGPGPAGPPLRSFISGSSLAVGPALGVGFGVVALLVVAVVLVACGLALWRWAPWFRRGSGRRLG
jgi:hypothetical protein